MSLQIFGWKIQYFFRKKTQHVNYTVLHYCAPNHPALYLILKYQMLLETEHVAWDKEFSGHPHIIASIMIL